MNEYNNRISGMLNEIKQKKINHLKSQDMELGNDDYEDINKIGHGVSHSGFERGYNEMTGAFEKQNGIEQEHKTGSGHVEYNQVRKNHEQQSVYGAGVGGKIEGQDVPEMVGNMIPSKGHGIHWGPYSENGSGYWDHNGPMTRIEGHDEKGSGHWPENGPVIGNGKKKKKHGAGFWSDFADGFMSVVGPVAKIAESVIPIAKSLGGKRGRPKKGGNMGPQLPEGIRMEKNGKLLLTKPQLAGDSMNGGAKAKMKGLEKIGGKKQTLKDKENEKIAMEIKGIKDIAGNKDIEKTGLGKKKMTPWTTLVKKIMKEKSFKKMTEAIKYIKDNNLYKK